MSLLELDTEKAGTPIERVLAYQKATRTVGNAYYDWDPLMAYAQASIGRKDYLSAATLATGMLANIPNVDNNRNDLYVITQSESGRWFCGNMRAYERTSLHSAPSARDAAELCVPSIIVDES